MTLSRQRYMAVLTVCSLLLPLFASPVSADTMVMPRDLVDFATANGCAPINDFFERPGMINPPYVLLDAWAPGATGVNAVDREKAIDSAAFWCKKVEKSDKPYKLMFKVSDPQLLAGCPASIEWRNPPAGLSTETHRNLSLSDFHYVTDPQRSVPSGVVANAKVIVNDNNDGLIDIFYCYRGQWLVSSYH